MNCTRHIDKRQYIDCRTQQSLQDLLTLKIWPLVVLTAINRSQRKGGAVRIWFIARSIDTQGSGWVRRSELLTLLKNLDIGKRKQRRWLRLALKLGLLVEGNLKGDIVYSLVSLGRGAALLGCKQVGRPATLNMGDFIRPGWRSFVWAAYLTTTKERPISQETKHKITGVDPRTQRNYQRALPGGARRNFAQTDLKGDHVLGLRDNGRGAAFVGRDGQIIYRLPDSRHVPEYVAKPAPKGRSRKAQKVVNHLCSMAQVKVNPFRLFHETPKGAKAALRKLSREDIPPWEMPSELFELEFAGRTTNLWQPVSVQL